MPYRTQSSDTIEAADRAHYEILRRMSRRERAKMAARLTARNWAGMKRALLRAHPDWTPQQLQIEWVRIQYGEGLARSYAASLGASLPQEKAWDVA